MNTQEIIDQAEQEVAAATEDLGAHPFLICIHERLCLTGEATKTNMDILYGHDDKDVDIVVMSREDFDRLLFETVVAAPTPELQELFHEVSNLPFTAATAPTPKKSTKANKTKAKAKAAKA